MTDITEGASAPPPKKRSFFKKAAWQTEAKADPGKDEDMFSHSNEFRDIVNEEKLRRQKERTLAEEKRRPQTKEQDRKRRKASPDAEASKELRTGTGSSPRSCRKERKPRRQASLSPSLPIDASPTPLGQPYDDLAKLSSPIESKIPPQKFSNVIDLGDSDSDLGGASYNPPKPYPQSFSKPVLVESDNEQEVEDPLLAELAAKARARAANTLVATATESGASANMQHDPIVQLFITSDIPESKPLLVRVRCSSTVSRPRESWCKIQGFSPEMTRDVFLTWKHKMILDSTTIKRLGITIDSNGIVSVEGDSDIYTDDNLPKIHLEAWTEDLFRQMQRERAEEEAAKKRAAEEASKLAEIEPEPESEPEPAKKKFRLFLKAKGKSEWKICVNSDTTIEHLTSAYKDSNNIPKEQPVTLFFDGERLRPMDTIADTEIDDRDSIEVHFK